MPRFLPPAVLTAACFVLLLQTTDLTLADLGRHLKNGEVLLHGSWQEKQAVLHTNFYSYTEGDFPFINHHWLSGVVFYLIWRLASFEGLTIFYAALVSLALLLFYWIAQRASNATVAAPLAALALPFVTWRADVRPEGFTYLFLAVFLWVLTAWHQGRLQTKWLYSLPLVMWLWVNLHIGFILGFVVLGMFFLKVYPEARGRKIAVLSVAGLSALAGAVNPSWLRGLLYPLTIFRNYGYAVGENQSILTEQSGAGWRWQYGFFEVLLLVIAAGFVLAWLTPERLGREPGRASRAPEILLLASVAVLAVSAVRNLPVFCFLMIPILAGLVHGVISGAKGRWPRFVSAALCVVGLVACWRQYADRSGFEGIGLRQDVNDTAAFLAANGIAGPIFNDYNNGGYLIFHRFHVKGAAGSNGDRVFVDARPEAYPAAFFGQLAGMQADEKVWDEMDGMYHFNAIVFSLQFNNSPETEKFILTRVRDPQWAPVFADYYNLIFVRRTEANAEVIRSHEIPRDRFR
jgi:hypothetical protein